MRWCLFCPQRPGDAASVDDLVIACHERDVSLSLKLAADLAMQRLLVAFYRQQEVGSLLLELVKNGFWVSSASAWISTPPRFNSPSNCYCCAEPGARARPAPCSPLWRSRPGRSPDREQRSRESPGQCRRSRPEAICRATTGGGHDRAPQGLAVTHQLIEISCTTWDLSNCPVPGCVAQGSHVNLPEEVAES